MLHSEPWPNPNPNQWVHKKTTITHSTFTCLQNFPFLWNSNNPFLSSSFNTRLKSERIKLFTRCFLQGQWGGAVGEEEATWSSTRTWRRKDRKRTQAPPPPTAQRVSTSELVVGAQQQGLFIVPTGADGAVAAGQGRAATSLQRGLLRVLLIGRRKVVNGVLDHVARVHRLLQAAGDALHWGTTAWRTKVKVSL